MKALSLWQPWADLVALGYKTMETRFWRTDYRGPLLICAAKRHDLAVRDHIEMFTNLDIWECLFDDTYPQLPPEYEPRLGVAVAIAEVTDYIRLTEGSKRREAWRRAACLPSPYVDDEANWSLDGRWGWVLEDIIAIEPFPVRGKQGLFDFEVPPSVSAIDQAYCWEQMKLFKEASSQ